MKTVPAASIAAWGLCNHKMGEKGMVDNVSQRGSPPLTLTMFGPMEVLIGGCPIGPLRSRKALWALALLALRHNRAVERDWLAGTLWPDVDQPRAFANLRTVLSELRKALLEEGDRIQSPSRDALYLDITGIQSDLVDFDEAIKSGKVSDLERAIALYKGPLLEGCAEEWVHQERDSREQSCLWALEKLGEQAFAAGHLARAVELYRRIKLIDPWRDSAVRGLMTALHRSGDLNAALHEYREFATFIQADGHASPDEATTVLYNRLRSEAKRKSAAYLVEARAAEPPTVLGYLPSPMNEIMGREDERLAVTLLLKQSRLVTLTGPGGIGKTRLALEVASELRDEFRDGVWFVGLESLTDGGQVASRIASVLNVNQGTDSPPVRHLVERLRKKRLLVILDNCEHLLSGCAEVVRSLLSECYEVRILATSREALGLIGESTWLVPALELPDIGHLPKGSATMLRVISSYESVQLFVARGRAANHCFSIAESNALAVAEICILLQGVPLAIELAAAWVKSKTLASIAKQIGENVGLLDVATRSSTSRQQTLRSTIEWSYRLLSESDRLLFRRVSMFRGGWTQDAAVATCSGNGITENEILASLSSLVEKSLVSFGRQGDEPEDRYRMLDTVRQFAEEELKDDQEREWLAQQHRIWFAAFSELGEKGLRGPDQGQWAQRLSADRANLVRCMDFVTNQPEALQASVRIAGALTRYWGFMGAYLEGSSYLQKAVHAARSSDYPKDLAKALRGLGSLRTIQGDYEATQKFHEEALAISDQLNDANGVAESSFYIGFCLQQIGRCRDAKGHLYRALELYRGLNDPYSVAACLDFIGSNEIIQGHFVEAKNYYLEALNLHRALSNSRNIAWCLNHLGNVALSQGNYCEAEGYYQKSLLLFQESSDRRGVAWSKFKVGEILVRQREPKLALPYIEEAVLAWTEQDDRIGLAWARHALGDIAFDEGTFLEAMACYQEAVQRFQEMGDRRGIAVSTTGLGMVAFVSEDFARAKVLFQQAIQELATVEDTDRCLEGIEALISVLILEGQVGRAALLLGFSSAFREKQESAVSQRLSSFYESNIAALKAHAGEGFGALWAEGRCLQWEDAAHLALEDAASESQFRVSARG